MKQEVNDVLVVGVRRVFQVLLELWVVKVEVSDNFRPIVACRSCRVTQEIVAVICPLKVRFLILLCEAMITSIGVISNRDLLELHVVLGQCASLIREDVINLAERLIKVTRLNAGLRSALQIAQINVPFNEETLHETDRLYCDNQRNRHEEARHYHPSTTVCQCIDQDLQFELLVIHTHTRDFEAKIGVFGGGLKGPLVRDIAKEEAHYELDHESEQYQSIEK